MKSIIHDIVGAENPLEESRKRLLAAKRKIYERIRAQLAKERPVAGACPRTQRKIPYEYDNLVRNHQ